MLLARGGRFGLADSIQVNATRPADAAARPGTVSQGDTAPAFAINQHTWGQIWMEFDPAFFDPTLAQAQQADRLAQLQAMAVVLPECPAGSVTGKECYYGWSFETPGPNNTYTLQAPGTFNYAGVDFAINEQSGGRFQKVLSPNAWARARIEWRVIRASQQKLLGDHGNRAVDRDALGTGDISAALDKQVPSFTPNRNAVIANAVRKASVDQIMAAVPDLALYLLNFERNPVQPTVTERTGEGGWVSWLSRGGYPLSKSVAIGQTPLGTREAIAFPASIYCRCPATGLPNALPGFLGKKGPTSSLATDHISFNSFVSIPQNTVSPQLTLALIAVEDASWITDVGEWGAKILTFLGNAWCGALAPVAQDEFSKTMAERCVDATGKVCMKGKPGCNCSTPPVYSQGSVAAYGVLQNWMCQKWMSETAPPPPLPAPDPLLPPAPAMTKLPWWLVIGGGLVIGGALFARK